MFLINLVTLLSLWLQHSDRERHWKDVSSQSQRERDDLLDREATLQAQITDLQEEIR